MNGLIGTRVEQYQIEARIGQGHLGTVYRARDLNLGRPVVIKVMHQPLADQPSFQQHVMQAAQAASRLNHPSIVKIYNFDNSHGLLYIVMEVVPGPSLAAALKQAAQQNQVVRLDETLQLIAQVADALSHAHQQGIVHGNLRPDNVLLKVVDRPTRAGEPPIRAILTDFGLGSSQEGKQWPANNPPDVVPYFSPEQCRGGAMDSRADIYSLGVLLYRMTTGNLPFAATSPAEVVARHGREPLSALHYLRPSVPTMVNRIIKIAMANKADERFQNAEQVADALRRAVAMLTEADALLFAPQGAVVSLVSLLQQATQQPESSPALAAFSWDELLSEQPGPPPLAPQPAQQPTRQLRQAAPPPSQNNTKPFPQPGIILPPLIREDSRIRVDQLIITRRGGAPRTVSLDRSAFRIGRSRNNDIILSTPDVSRRHARLAQTTTGWQIVDLHSSGGTYLGARKLAPSVPETWDSGQPLRIGPYLLRRQRPGEAHVEGASSSRAASAAPRT
ncbi:MAG TPA: FHA domain-containing serine/threonine-protein kinase, partial [Anaerolineae bacterium]